MSSTAQPEEEPNMKKQVVNLYAAWAEAERLANGTELALRNVRRNGHTPDEYLLDLASERRRAANEQLLLWRRDVEDRSWRVLIKRLEAGVGPRRLE